LIAAADHLDHLADLAEVDDVRQGGVIVEVLIEKRLLY